MCLRDVVEADCVGLDVVLVPEVDVDLVPEEWMLNWWPRLWK